MQKFIYKAKTKEGKIVTGTVEAAVKKTAIKLLHEKKLIIFSLRQKTSGSILSVLDAFRGTSAKDITLLTRQLATMINAGLTLINSLTIIQEEAKPALVKLLNFIIRKIEGGSSFHQALRAYPDIFRKSYISLVKSGESAGKLDKILAELADSLEKQEAFKRKVKGALIYPFIVLVGMIVVAFVMMIYVIPQLTIMYEEMDADLPLPTEVLIFVSNSLSSFWYLIIIIVIGLIYAFVRWRKTDFGKEQTDKFILKIPIINKLITKIILAQLSRTLSMLISAGVPIIEALNIVEEVAGNAVFEKSINLAAKDVEKGLTLTSALGKFDEYPPLVIQMISVGEQTGKVGEVLSRVADYFEQEAEEAIKGLTTAIEPVMMIILGIGVGFIVISIITPIYNLTTQF